MISLDRRYVLILGAGLMQKPAIFAAKKNGYVAVVIDANPEAMCVPFADVFRQIDLKDKEKILDFARELGDNLKGVFTAGTDFTASVSYVCQNLGLPSHTYEASVNATNKVVMRGCFRDNDVPSPDFIQLDKKELADFDCTSFEYPKVIKPVDNMGARGCRLIRSRDEFPISVKNAIDCSRSGNAIFEDYMEGPEFSIDALVYENTVTITGFADRHIYFPPYFIETGHTMPTDCNENMYRDLIVTFAKGIKALGLTHGAAKADIKYTKNGAMIGEIAGRLSGGYMSGWTFPYSSGVDLTEQALLMACGQVPQTLIDKRVPLNFGSESGFELYNLPSQEHSAERAWISIPGTVSKIYGYREAQDMPFIRDVFPRTVEGDAVVFPRNNVEKCGNVISRAPDRSSAIKASENAVAKIVLRLEKNNPQTDAFLSGMEDECEEGFPFSAYDFSSIGNPVFEQAVAQLKSQAMVGENQGLVDFAEKKLSPQFVASFGTSKDFNHRSFMETLELFDRLVPRHGKLPAEKLFSAIQRGGIQGGLYYCDCNSQAK